MQRKTGLLAGFFIFTVVVPAQAGTHADCPKSIPQHGFPPTPEVRSGNARHDVQNLQAKKNRPAGRFSEAMLITSMQPEQQQRQQRQQQPKRPKQQPKQPKRQRQQQPERPEQR
jgi:hypothetical protein